MQIRDNLFQNVLRIRFLKVCLLLLVLALCCNAERSLAKSTTLKQSAPPAVTARHLMVQFPKNTALGILRINHDFDPTDDSTTVFGPAQGIVNMNLLPDQVCSLELEGKVYQHPEWIDQIKDQPIDAIKVCAFSMEDSEPSLTDKMLVHIAKIKALNALNSSRSDATDEGIACLKDMPNLRTVILFCCEVKGSCLKELAKSQSIERVDLWALRLNENNLQSLSSFPKLTYLNVTSSNVGLVGCGFIGKCSKLTTLQVSDNPVDDRCVALFKDLKQLKKLDLAGTKVTINGVRQLKGLHLTELVLTSKFGNADRTEIVSLFPHTTVRFPGKGVINKKVLDLYSNLH